MFSFLLPHNALCRVAGAIPSSLLVMPKTRPAILPQFLRSFTVLLLSSERAVAELVSPN